MYSKKDYQAHKNRGFVQAIRLRALTNRLQVLFHHLSPAESGGLTWKKSRGPAMMER